ncbi:MAG: hypothetical protein ABIS36_08910, partial [Chryseolinea sp.]
MASVMSTFDSTLGNDMQVLTFMHEHAISKGLKQVCDVMTVPPLSDLFNRDGSESVTLSKRR